MWVRLLIFALIVVSTSVCDARPRRGYSTKYRSVPAGFSNSTAQGVAEIQAHLGVCGHFGGNPGYEGCGCAHSPEAALRSCCFSNSGMPVVDQGVAQSKNGMWYACKRYGRR